ncbi:DUF2786 domain-containing protein [Streptomyces sp. V4-01]|uniref:DUF2786 domain-containing protein n=1 Tax=Actinacidiphila polyblastidii TaxID=3110430 RepID=A0ABU7PIU7_9ACTN|nr:DUF2786 domain-containing protein [Streptomyces sp. V4-01]
MTAQAAFDAALSRAMAAPGGFGAGQPEVDAAASVLAAAGGEYGPWAAGAWQRVRRECAARGWTPADLVRMAVRELGARPARLAGLLAEGAEGAGGAGDAGDLAGFARDERLDRFSAAAEFVDLMRLYGCLPRIAALPAGGGAGPAHGEPKMLGRIRALLAKAESTGFPQEAEALTEKAQHLMARYSVDQALLDGVSGGGPGARRIGVDRPYDGAKALLLDAVAKANRCEAVWAREFGFSTVVGHEGDLDAVELLYTSLLVQADRALHRGKSRSRDFRESFLTAYAVRIRERLSAAVREEVAAYGLLPVLASRDAAVRDARARLFPSTTSTRLRGGRDPEGHADGEAAATHAHL